MLEGNGLTRGLARELGCDNTRVNNIAPSAVLTEGTREFFGEKDERALEVIAGGSAIRRNLHPKDVCDSMLWLVSEQSAFVIGQTIAVDGGTVMLQRAERWFRRAQRYDSQRLRRR